jgi:hypothetical protein
VAGSRHGSPGLAACTVREVAAAGPLTKSAIHYYFYFADMDVLIDQPDPAGGNRGLFMSDGFADTERGLIGSLEPCVIKNADDQVVWDNDAFGFLSGECPDTANPSLWRQSRLCARQGLFDHLDRRDLPPSLTRPRS